MKFNFFNSNFGRNSLKVGLRNINLYDVLVIIGRVKFGGHAPNTIHHFVYILYCRWYDGYDKKRRKNVNGVFDIYRCLYIFTHSLSKSLVEIALCTLNIQSNLTLEFMLMHSTDQKKYSSEWTNLCKFMFGYGIEKQVQLHSLEMAVSVMPRPCQAVMLIFKL